MKCFFAVCCTLLLSFVHPAQSQTDGPSALAEKLLRLTPKSVWTLTDSIPLQFNAFHTQGIIKYGNNFIMTAVEVTQWPKKFDKPSGKPDRDAGKGIGHIFQFDGSGKLLYDIKIGEGDAYHPGGIDFDGKYVWIPVTEYRPNSFSIIYRFDPATRKVTEVLRVQESIGAIVHNTDNNTLTGANWDARRFYTWQLAANDRAADAVTVKGVENPSFFVAHQDATYLGNHLMLGSGFNTYEHGKEKFKLGGWEIVDLRDFRPVRQLPIPKWSATGASMLNNPCTVEATGNGLRAFFVPDDDLKAVLYVFNVE